ncbi:MAG: hypothetical protein COA57_01340 [Flavobacteriales bacterium]|nr:hypothetical protein [Bacteroidales bacterium AH-315-I05]PCJ89685.1 MAG: hypothetical protein COA57_01340 [Flavobacteriales bacterium]
MMKTLIISILLTFPIISILAQEENKREFQITEGDTTYTMKQYFMVFLLRGEKANEFSEEQLKEIQVSHLEHINRMSNEANLIIAGPFGDDTEKRGVLIFDLATSAEVEQWVSQDPAVKAGRLTYEIHPWWAAKGSVLQ